MSSESTILFKKSEALREDKFYYEKIRYPMGFTSICLWTLAALIAAANTRINNHVSGVSVTFRVQDVLTTLFTTCMLARGFATSNHYLLYPWLMVSCWNLYHFQYTSLAKMMATLYGSKKVSTLAWATFGIHVLGLVVKIMLVFRVLQLSINLWYQNKLQSETINKYH